ncbi:MBOAT family O-acyltransferase [Hydrogenophaga sp. BPS33]|uniref:MBOAT family O-acyltransferase n=1 Tax=Hydrogenophaga sp. BPS33 TaxID=2651974 RepID=UPI0013204EB6|nr:MBOAT family protein [Hydrogenophaga sp. BPS33]QHE85927.1 MBOAT family protein [Hydrogenophaga sp. BPS33]
MLFTTSTFAFLYLPIVLCGYFLLGWRSSTWPAVWLFLASVFFYGYWVPEFTLLLLGSIAANFLIGRRIAASERASRFWLVVGLVFNLGLLAYFKYANFFVDNINAVLGSEWRLGRIVLPIGISFFTFTQIAYLVDTWQNKVREVRWVHYGLFVTYFPHLVAGPVLHHAQMMPQFANPAVYRFDATHFGLGLVIFSIGLFKKVVLADGIAPYADAVFNPADSGVTPGSAEAWIAALAYTFQLYFDFSGYSDMAIGLSWMFNIRLPFNFNSPYKATSISDFWRRWHISLSNFLRDYLYVSLGGNRRGVVRRYLNLALTMLLGGLWHGASWSFILWGTLHGAYLVINHLFRAAMERLGLRSALDASRAFTLLAWALTFLAVVVAWVFFRAETLDGAQRVLLAMLGRTPAHTDAGLLLWNAGLEAGTAIGWCVVLGAMAVLLPNSNAMGERLSIWLRRSAAWRPAVIAAALVFSACMVVLNTARDAVSAFIYFNF